MIVGMNTLFLALSVTITQYIYPIIPRLYSIFEYCSNYRFLEVEQIEKIWNNIYVLVGVIVLFAIAIKLIGAIVNPDSLGDNKKGARGTFLRAIIAVVLIFICPILFKTMFNIQGELLSNNSLLTRVYGINLGETNLGQMLAWKTFSSFCIPIDKETGKGLNNSNFNLPTTDIDASTGDLAEYYAVADNMDNIQNLDNEIFWGQVFPSLNWGFEYHPILCPIAGILIAYELLLLCMDTIFRTIKLAMLQLMLPIVLGAFVFNADILKKWAKEFFSTYIIIFLKVLAIGFLVLGLVAIQGGV